jgi:CO/xanthine dehydrogenase FAD-binding subunit
MESFQMRPFDCPAPASLEEAVALLNERDLRVRLTAGVTDLLVQLRAGRFNLDRIMDLEGIPETNQLSYDPMDGLIIGVAIPCRRIYGERLIQMLYPALIDSALPIGSMAVRGEAAIGGNVCDAAPSEDSLPILNVLEADCRIIGPRGERTVPIEQFCTGPGRNVLERGELPIFLRIPPPRPNSGAHYLRFIIRNERDIAVMGVAANIELSEDLKKIVSARIALGTVAPTPVLVREVGDFLSGKTPCEAVIGQAAYLARDAAGPTTEIQGSIPYRRHLVGILAKRALQGAIERARRIKGRPQKEHGANK